MSHDEIKESPMYQRYQFASYLNRRFILDEASLVDSNSVSMYPKGTSYNHFHAFYEFTTIRSLFFGAVHILRSCSTFDKNADVQDKWSKLQRAIRTLEEFDILGDLTSHMAKLKC